MLNWKYLLIIGLVVFFIALFGLSVTMTTHADAEDAMSGHEIMEHVRDLENESYQLKNESYQLKNETYQLKNETYKLGLVIRELAKQKGIDI